MGKKKNTDGKRPKGWYCFARDLLSSQRYRRCSWTTKGVYFDTLNVLSLQTHPGALCLKDFDLKPKSERSLTFRCLQCQKKAKNGEYQSLKYFAEAIAVSASGPRPGLIHGLQELYLRGIIVIEGDTLIQPRMYRDNGFKMADIAEYMKPLDEDGIMIVAGSPDDGDADPDAEKIRLGETVEKTDHNGTQKGTEKDAKNSRVGAGDAHAQSKRVGVGVRDNNIIENKGNIGGVGERETTAAKGKGKDKPASADGGKEHESGTDTPRVSIKNEKETARKSKKGSQTAVGNKHPVGDNPPSLEEIQAYCDERREQGKAFLYITAEEFLDICTVSAWTRGKQKEPIYDWKAYLRQCDLYRQRHGDAPVGQRPPTQAATPKAGDPVQVAPNKDGKYRKW